MPRDPFFRMRALAERTEGDLRALLGALGPVLKSGRREAPAAAGVLAMARPLLADADRVVSRRLGRPVLPRLSAEAGNAELAVALRIALGRLVDFRLRQDALDAEFQAEDEDEDWKKWDD